MAREKGTARKANKIKLSHPDRSGPSEATLLDLAQERGLLSTPSDDDTKDDSLDENGEPLIGRMGEAFLWSISLTMLHFTLDVLVAHQYAQDIQWGELGWRTAQAFPLLLLLFHTFHPHPTPSFLLPSTILPSRIIPSLHQVWFFLISISAGCYLIFITNMHGYYAVMKRAPPVGTIWIWSVIELDVIWATASLVVCGLFLKLGGYAFL